MAPVSHASVTMKNRPSAVSPLSLTFHTADTGAPVELVDFHTVVAGYTGRDHVSVHRHIAELAAIGVTEPDVGSHVLSRRQ